MPIEHLTDAADPRLEPYRILRDPELVRHSQCFVAEGRLVVRTLLASQHWPVQSVLVTPTALEDMRADLERLAADVPCYVLDRAALLAIGKIHFHQGCLAMAERPRTESIGSFCTRQGGPLWIGFDAVGNPDNVGAVFRSARALGADAALLSSTSCSPLYRKAVRTSMGASLLLPFLHATEDWAEVLSTVRNADRVIWALTPDDAGQPLGAALAEADPEEARLLVLGAEGEGVGAATRAAAHRRVRIPMRADMDSLNVAAAAAIALYVFQDHRVSVG